MPTDFMNLGFIFQVLRTANYLCAPEATSVPILFLPVGHSLIGKLGPGLI